MDRYIAQSQEDKPTCDFVIMIRQKKEVVNNYGVHKFIMHQSQYFRSITLNSFRESASSEIVFDVENLNVSLEAFSVFINLFYQSRITKTPLLEQYCLEIHHLAVSFGFNRGITSCEEIMRSILNFENIQTISDYFKNYGNGFLNSKRLYICIIQFLKHHFICNLQNEKNLVYLCNCITDEKMARKLLRSREIDFANSTKLKKMIRDLYSIDKEVVSNHHYFKYASIITFSMKECRKYKTDVMFQTGCFSLGGSSWTMAVGKENKLSRTLSVYLKPDKPPGIDYSFHLYIIKRESTPHIVGESDSNMVIFYDAIGLKEEQFFEENNDLQKLVVCVFATPMDYFE